ncbi:MAG: tetratricopeptide repeat protein [Hyphomicrobium sp.]
MLMRGLALLLMMLSLSAPAASADVMTGRHTVKGTTPQGGTYRGKLDIALKDGVYYFRWYISSGEIYDGQGKLEGDTLTIEWGDPTPVIYKVKPNGVLQGTWGGGRGTETVTPEKETIAQNNVGKDCDFEIKDPDRIIKGCSEILDMWKGPTGHKSDSIVPTFFLLRAEAYIDKGAYDEALADVASALEISPTMPGAYSVRARIRGQRSEFKLALEDIDNAIALTIPPFDPDAHDHYLRGVILEGLGDAAGAQAAFTQALKINPAHKGAQGRLAAAGAAGSGQQSAEDSKCAAGDKVVASGAIIQVNPPSGEGGWSIAVDNSENGACEHAILLQFARNAAQPQSCSIGNFAEATGSLVDDGEGYTIFDPANLRCTPAPRADPPECAGGAHATVTGAIKSAKLSANTSGQKSFNIALRRWTKTGACSVELIYLDNEAADCVAGAQIEATGTIEADALFGAYMIKVDKFTCKSSGAPRAGTEAKAEKGPAAQPAAAQSPAALECANNRGELAKKIAACTELIAQDANNAVAYRNRGAAYSLYCSGNVPQCDLAIADYTKSLELEPKLGPEHAEVLLWRSTNYKFKGDKDKARADLSMAIELDPAYVAAYHQRGVLLEFEFGDYAAAVADYDKAIQLKPGDSLFYGLRARAHQGKGDYKSAISDIEKSLQISPDATYERTLANLKSVVANPDPALECAAELSHALGVKACSQLIEKNPGDAGAYIHRANLQRGKKQFQPALADYDKAIALDARQAAYFKERAQLHGLMNALEKQLADHDTVIALDPNNAESYAKRAAVFSVRRMFDKSVADWTKAIKLDPQTHLYLCDRADDYASLGDAKREEADRTAAEKLTGEQGYCDW